MTHSADLTANDVRVIVERIQFLIEYVLLSGKSSADFIWLVHLAGRLLLLPSKTGYRLLDIGSTISKLFSIARSGLLPVESPELNYLFLESLLNEFNFILQTHFDRRYVFDKRYVESFLKPASWLFHGLRFLYNADFGGGLLLSPETMRVLQQPIRCFIDLCSQYFHSYLLSQEQHVTNFSSAGLEWLSYRIFQCANDYTSSVNDQQHSATPSRRPGVYGQGL